MTILTSIILVAAIVLVVTFIAYQMQKGTKALSEFKADYDNNAEVQELADLATELYNKELRPVAPKKTIKNIELDIEVTPKDITPQVIEKAVEVADIAPVNVEAIVEVVKPAKKKRKYHSKAPNKKA